MSKGSAAELRAVAPGNRPPVPASPPKGGEENGGSGRFLEFLALDRTRILALGAHITIDQLDDRDRGGVGGAQAGLDDAGVAAVAARVARRQHVEQLDQLGVVEQAGVRQAAVREAALL